MSLRIVALALGAAGLIASMQDALSATVQTMSPQGEVALVRQARFSFSESMTPFGDLRQAPPVDLRCPETGTGRWVDDKTWVFDFQRDVPAGTRCSFDLKPGLKTLAGASLSGASHWEFSTGGPAVVRAYPAANEEDIDEEQAFALLLNGPATAASITQFAYCQAQGVQERIGIVVISGTDRDAILKATGLTAQAARSVVVKCQRPIAPESVLEVVWAKGIATPSGVASSHDRRLKYKVRPAFTASFTCERENAQADCLPIRPLRIEFSAPVPRALAEKIVLKTSDGEHKPVFEENGGEEGGVLVSARRGHVRKWWYFFGRGRGTLDTKTSDNAVSAVQFQAPFPESADLSIEVPAQLKDESGRGLSNATLFPLKTRTAGAPPLAKFAATPFGILELNAEPLVPVTVRGIEKDLQVKNLKAGGTLTDLNVTQAGGGDGAIIRWLARVHHYDESTLEKVDVTRDLGIQFAPPPATPPAARADKRPTTSYGREVAPADDSDKTVESRSFSLLNREGGAQRVVLPQPAAGERRPFEVVGVPLRDPGFYVLEIQSQDLGRALLGRDAPMFVRTSVLVTNLAVHFKHGELNSGVWVTTLDRGQVVPDAEVQVSSCTGDPLWQGKTDLHGFALIDQALPAMTWSECTIPGTDYHSEEGYFVSARKTDAQGRADMAFAWSTWNSGIESWRFNLAHGNSGSVPVIAHTVLDRRLLRAGETLSMKHFIRHQDLVGMRVADQAELPDQVVIEHLGSNTKYEFPLKWRERRAAETTFKIPVDAKLGEYSITLRNEERSFDTGSFRVEEFRVPMMEGRIVPPKDILVQPQSIPIGLQVNYGNGGGAADLAVRVSAQLRAGSRTGAIDPNRYPGFTFQAPREPGAAADASVSPDAYVDENDDERSVSERDASDARLVADKLAVKLDKNGAGQVALAKLPPVTTPQELLVEATYADPNGEMQTISQTMTVWPSALILGIRTDQWVSVNQKLRVQLLALDTTGRPEAGVPLHLSALVHQTTSIRKRLVGGFYAYDNQNSDRSLGEVCSGTSDSRGLVFCDVKLDDAGEIELVSQANDSGGHVARSAASVWVTGEGEVWFGGDNQDRMDVIPEQRSYAPGQTARFQVRMPFRAATALIAIERNGIIETQTVTLHGQDPTIELPVKAEWGPNVFVSVLAVRGRIREVPWYSLFTWGWRAPVDWWHAWRDEGRLWQAPTAMVDLAKPAFKYGIAEIEVGIDAHRLKVDVTADKPSYPIRSVAHVRIKVAGPGGQPVARGTEVALGAVDEALLQLLPNPSTDLLAAMIRERAYGVETATAQMQVIGKRHFGRKAAPPGGGGGQFPTRELFDTLLVWNPHVVLDDHGEAIVDVPLNDSLTTFRIVAIADEVAGANAGLFGSGQTKIRATQDLQIVSGLPPLVREGDHYRTLLTVRNTTDHEQDVKLSAQTGVGAPLAPQQLKVAANSAIEAGWDVVVPYNLKSLDWTISAESSTARDRMKISQKVAEALPVTVQQATLTQLDHTLSLPVAAPAGALADAAGVLRGGIDIGLKPKLSDGLPGVEYYFRHYPWNCFEQRASVAIGLRDTRSWQALMAQLPVFIDGDGLVGYFPARADWPSSGSDSLTAYLLSAADEASRTGVDFSIPEAARSRMEAGLIAFVSGTVKRDFWVPAFLKNGDLDVRKLAALEALSRHGRVTPRLVQSIQILPNEWPTGAVIDWMLILERTPGLPERDRRLAEADQILRARLNMQGTRMGFSTERDDNWWWVMANGDVNANRMLLAVMELPAWKDDLPRLVTGSLQRQQAGSWSTTVANLWGSLALERFSRQFEREPVRGTTRAAFGSGPAQAFDWTRNASGGALALGWPAGSSLAGRASEATLAVTHEGSGKPWLTVVSRAAIPLSAPTSTGFRIVRTVTPVEEKTKGQVARGDVWRVHLDIDVQADATWVVVSDPIPAGATILGSGLGGDSPIAQAGEKVDWRGILAYEERSFEAMRSYYAYVPKGHFSFDYTIRLNNPGTFGLPPTRVEAMYAPEMFGEYPNSAVTIQ